MQLRYKAEQRSLVQVWAVRATSLVTSCALVASILLHPTGAAAQRGGIQLIRDAEIEHTIRVFAAPVFDAAGLDPNSVSVHLVNDSTINAFVAGGQRIFLNTGLLMRASSPNQLIGVIAHETGHIAGGHLARAQDALRSASVQQILALVLGAAAMATGSSGGAQIGSAAILGGQQVALRSLLQYSRTQEGSADQAGATFMERTGQSIGGLLEFLKVLGDQEVLLYGRQDPYVQTHPVSAERIATLQERYDRSRFKNAPDKPENIELFKRMQAKLFGYLRTLPETLQQYPLTDKSVPARYARAFAYYRDPQLDKALAEVDSLIAERPDDPYFYELKSQIFYDNGKVADSIGPIQTAVKLAPAEPLLRFSLGQVQLATEDPALVKPAIGNLEDVVRRDPQNGSAWEQLAVGYGRDNNLGMAALASAERFLLQGVYRDARGQAERAVRLLPANTPAWIRAQDLVEQAKIEREQQRRQ